MIRKTFFIVALILSWLPAAIGQVSVVEHGHFAERLAIQGNRLIALEGGNFRTQGEGSINIFDLDSFSHIKTIELDPALEGVGPSMGYAFDVRGDQVLVSMARTIFEGDRLGEGTKLPFVVSCSLSTSEASLHLERSACEYLDFYPQGITFLGDQGQCAAVIASNVRHNDQGSMLTQENGRLLLFNPSADNDVKAAIDIPREEFPAACQITELNSDYVALFSGQYARRNGRLIILNRNQLVGATGYHENITAFAESGRKFSFPGVAIRSNFDRSQGLLTFCNVDAKDAGVDDDLRAQMFYWQTSQPDELSSYQFGQAGATCSAALTVGSQIFLAETAATWGQPSTLSVASKTASGITHNCSVSMQSLGADNLIMQDLAHYQDASGKLWLIIAGYVANDGGRFVKVPLGSNGLPPNCR